MKNIKYSLVLSGGGALSISQLGIINQLEKQKLEYKEIIGTSMGSIIGACMAIGLKEEEIFNFFKKFSKIHNWIKFSFSGNSIVDDEKIKKILIEVFKNKKMKDTIIPLKIIATNLKDGSARVFNQNDDLYIYQAILASIAIPGVFKEQLINDNIYADGFLIQNLGILEVSSSNIIAIDSLGINSYNSSIPNKFIKTLNVFSMIEKSMRLLIINQTKCNIEKLLKDYIDYDLKLIDLDTRNFKTFDFNKFEEIRNIGIKYNKLNYLRLGLR